MDTPQVDALEVSRTCWSVPTQPTAVPPQRFRPGADREWDVSAGRDSRGTVVVLAGPDEEVTRYDELGRSIAELGFHGRGFHTGGARPLDLGRRVRHATQGLARPVVLIGRGIAALLALRFAHWGDVPASGVVVAAPSTTIGDDHLLAGLVEQAWTGHGRMPGLVLHAAEQGLDSLNVLSERTAARPSFRLASVAGPADEVLGGRYPSGMGDIVGFLRRFAESRG
jgi:hypothetical protein